MKKRGKYYKSLKDWLHAGGDYSILHAPSIHISGSVRGMRKLFWGYECDVVRIGNYIYKAS